MVLLPLVIDDMVVTLARPCLLLQIVICCDAHWLVILLDFEQPQGFP